jgi:hypothetical protein
MTRSHLDDKEKETIKILAADGQSATKIGKQVKRNPHTVRKFLAEPEVERQVQDEKSVLAAKYRGKALKVLESINDEDISKASLQQKSISSGVLLDKSLLLTGEMPSINVTVLLDAVSAIRAMRRNPQVIDVQAPAPDLHQLEQQPVMQPTQQPALRVGQPERHGTRYYSIPHERHERRIPLQADPNPD